MNDKAPLWGKPTLNHILSDGMTAFNWRLGVIKARVTSTQIMVEKDPINVWILSDMVHKFLAIMGRNNRDGLIDKVVPTLVIIQKQNLPTDLCHFFAPG
jgi:predicted aspartyl protease